MIRGIHRIASVLAVALVAALVPIGSAAGAVSIAVAPPPATLRSVSMIDASTAVAVAANGTIWRTTSSGSDWTQVRVADAYDFRAVDFWNTTKGVAVDLQGKVAKTENGGVTWTNVDFTPYADMDGLTAAKNHNGLACIPGTTDAAISVGGDPDIFDDTNIGAVAMRTWGQIAFWQNAFFQAQPYKYDLGDGTLVDIGEGEFLDVSFVNGTHGWAVGRDTYEPGDHKPALYRTTNTGGSWTTSPLGHPATLNAVAFGSTTAGVVAGQLVADGTPRAYYTTNGGTGWSQGDLPPGIGIPRALHMTSATNGWLAGDGGTLLRTTNGGQTWTACVTPDGFTANLYDVELVGTTGIAVGTNAVLLTTDGITWTGASAPATPADVDRIEGADRIATAIAAAKVAFPSGAGTVVIATARNWPDALGGAALAGAVDGPILLTEPTALPSTVAQAISELGASKAIILGGTAAVSSGVQTALGTALGGAGNVTRIDGADRYETARKVAAETVKRLGSFSGTAFIATGANFPDALAASPLAAAKGWPIYLVRPTGVDDALVTAMKAAGVNKVIILGGTGAVPASVESALKTRVPGAYTRLQGADRYATALDVATYGVSSAGLSWNKVAVATGANFPDALAGGVLQGRAGSVMVLTPSASLYEGVRLALTANKDLISEARILGGTGAVSTAVATAVGNALK